MGFPIRKRCKSLFLVSEYLLFLEFCFLIQFTKDDKNLISCNTTEKDGNLIPVSHPLKNCILESLLWQIDVQHCWPCCFLCYVYAEMLILLYSVSVIYVTWLQMLCWLTVFCKQTSKLFQTNVKCSCELFFLSMILLNIPGPFLWCNFESDLAVKYLTKKSKSNTQSTVTWTKAFGL